MKLSPHEVAWLVLKVWPEVPHQRHVELVATVFAESGGDTLVIARSTTGANLGQRDHGLWQVSGRWNGDKIQRTPDWRDPLTNTLMARQIYDASVAAGKDGLNPWHAFTSGAAATYFPDAEIALMFPWPPPTAR